MSNNTTKTTLSILKDSEQDFEWYPTTTEIIETINRDMEKHFHSYTTEEMSNINVLDCGAGDGRALQMLSHGGDMYAIEKSDPLLNSMPDDIFIVGTDFHHSTLIDKRVDVVFCNPPYSEYVQWASKVILEANAKMVYLVIPSRWKDTDDITKAIETRSAEVKNIGTFDFLSADRQARAVVDILAIKLYDNRSYNRDKTPKIDPFDVWFDSQFVFEAEKVEEQEESVKKERLNNELAKGGGVIRTLVELYTNDMGKLYSNYMAVTTLDSEVIKELGVNVEGLKKGLRQKISGLKNLYWKELFDNYSPITSRLTNGSREQIMRKLTSNTSVDFTESNAYAVTAWAIKNANTYFDTQLVNLVQTMISLANIQLYKSNQRTFGREDWRYGREPETLHRFGLELRVVLDRQGGIKPTGASDWEYRNGLSTRANEFLYDICAVANNLGFSSYDQSSSMEWSSGRKNNFWMEGGCLMEVKGFMNGNLHIKFNQKFMRKLNVEFGRLKGWLKDKREASEELNIPINEVNACFNSNYRIEASNFPALMAA